MRKAILTTMVIAVLIAITSTCQLKQDNTVATVASEEFFNYTLHFCPEENCTQTVMRQLSGSKNSVECAFYTADASILGSIPAAAEIVFDENAKALRSNFSSGNLSVYKSGSKGIMHSKYCVIDGSTVITGSYNPTAAARNDQNNLLVINSTTIAGFYSQNFNLLKNRSQEKGKSEKTAILNKTLVKVYFCPYDSCALAVKKELGNARSSIVFAAYSFTNAEIANELILKSSEGVVVKGVMEKSTASSEYSKYKSLVANGINVTLRKSKGLMHNKFFVIDNATVITGSFNPTENADKRNDENIIIISNEELAHRYASHLNQVLAGEQFPRPR